MIKLCGVRRFEDIEYMNEVLPDYIGMILAEGFRRTVDIDTAERLAAALDGRIKKVGVFVDTPVERVSECARRIGFDVIQLHGSEDISYITEVKKLGIPLWKSVKVRCAEDIYEAEKLGCDGLLLDSFVPGQIGGTGISFDWSVISSAKISSPFFLAGGINEDNLAEALKISRNIDISGGVETDGVKDIDKIRRIMKIYKENQHEQG
ncbi:MAG: phosphoribosylanthranilate isomerase [Oscillospiraceae bacterium]